MTLILSLHIPKAAGSTLVASYRGAFGDRALYHNAHPDIVYETSKRDLEERYDVIHGHLDLSRLKGIIDDDTKIVTFLRDPVQRVVSSYHYHTKPDVTGDVATLVKSRNMSLAEFAQLPGQSNLQSRMIAPIGRDRLNFIGFSETFSDSLARLSDYIGTALVNEANRNANSDKTVGADYAIPEDTRRLIISRNGADQELYDWALRNI